jgi:tetratricopeptide (TPR) repeat protein
MPSSQTPILSFRLSVNCWLLLASVVVMNGGCRWTSMGQNTLGVRLYQQGRYTEALQQFQTAQTSDPTNPDTFYNLASTYHKLGVAQKDAKLIEQAESLYNQCLDLQPNHVDCHRGLAVLLAESGRPDRAMALLRNWATTNPQMADPRIELSRLNQEFGQTKLAEQYLDEALALNPNDYRAWTARGQMRESSGDLNQAIQNYQQSLAINSLQPELYQRVASLNVKIAQNSMAQPVGGWTAQTTPPPATNRY